MIQLTEPTYGNYGAKNEERSQKIPLKIAQPFFVKHILCRRLRRDNRAWCGMAVILMIPSS